MITSTHNQHVAYCRSLHRTSARQEAGAFLIEGVRLAREALDAGIEVMLALFEREALQRTAGGRDLLERLCGAAEAPEPRRAPRGEAEEPEAGDVNVGGSASARPAGPQLDRLPVYEVAGPALSAAAETRTPQGIVMVARQPEAPAVESAASQRLLLILDGMADGGNAGTVLRSAAAAGLGLVVFTGDSVDPWKGKVVRAGTGAHFRLGILETGWRELGPVLAGFEQVVAADAAGARTIYEVDWSRPTALVIGSEAHGMSVQARGLEPESVRIPMARRVESLNAGVAASIILFHAARSGLDYGAARR